MKQYSIDPRISAQGSEAILRTLLSDPDLEEVMYNGPGRPMMVVHRREGACRVAALLDDEFTWRFAREVAQANGSMLTEQTPLVDGVLADGSRINLTCPPASRNGVTFTIRKFLDHTLTAAHLIRGGTISAGAAAFLWCAIEGFGRAPANALVVGGTSTGKTTTLAALSLYIPVAQRIVVIEDTPEVRISHENMVSMVSSAQADMDHLLRNALRMRPDRIIVGEVRGPEAKTLFGAMNTGHDGCLGTLHANSARESISRVTHEPMGVSLAQVTALQLLIVMSVVHGPQGPQRIISEIAELTGFGEGVVRMNQLYLWNASRGRLERTPIPSRLQANISRATGIRNFERRRRQRESVLKQLSEAPPSAMEFVQRIQGA